MTNRVAKNKRACNRRCLRLSKREALKSCKPCNKRKKSGPQNVTEGDPCDCEGNCTWTWNGAVWFFHPSGPGACGQKAGCLEFGPCVCGDPPPDPGPGPADNVEMPCYHES